MRDLVYLRHVQLTVSLHQRGDTQCAGSPQPSPECLVRPHKHSFQPSRSECLVRPHEHSFQPSCSECLVRPHKHSFQPSRSECLVRPHKHSFQPSRSECLVQPHKHSFQPSTPALGARLAQSATQRGAALILVLWVIMLLSLIAASFSYTMRAELRQSAQFNERVQARALAEAGLHYAAVHFLQLGSGQQSTKQAMPFWPADGSEQVWQRPNAKVLIRVTDLSGRLDLNNANRELLGKLLLAGGVAKEQVNAVLDAIEDWRDSDDLPHMNGAERAEYQGAGRQYGPKNAPFESVEELLQVLGVEPMVYRRIAPELTVSLGMKGINPAYASPGLLLALSPDGTAPELVQQYVAERTQSQLNQQPAPPFPAAIPDMSSNRSMIYAIQSTARLDSGVVASVEATVMPGRSANLPYLLKNWRQSR